MSFLVMVFFSILVEIKTQIYLLDFTIVKIEFYSFTRSIDTYSMHKNLLQFHWQK